MLNYIGLIISAIIILIIYVFSIVYKFVTGQLTNKDPDSTTNLTSTNLTSTNITPTTAKEGAGGDMTFALLYERELDATRKFLESAPNLKQILNNANTCMLFSDIPHTLAYTQVRKVFKTDVHIGQLKLLLTEIEFLTDSLNANEPAIVVYAGSAPSNKIYQLSEMFRNIKFVLVDPNEHYVMYPNYTDMYTHMQDFMFFKVNRNSKYKDKIITTPIGDMPRGSFAGNVENICDIIENEPRRFFILEDYYTDEVSAWLHPLTQRHKVLFISDIRSRYEKSDNPSSLDIIWNSAMMYNWLDILKPARFMLKFRTPYEVNDEAYKQIVKEYDERPYIHSAFESCKIPMIENFKQGKFTYIKPEVIYMQAFAGPSSTESRLVGSTLELHDFDCNDYNDKYFYYNRIHRQYGFHTDHEALLSPELGIDRCGDCAIMCTVFKNYFDKYGGGSTQVIHDLIKNTLKTIRRDLKFSDTVHGRYFTKYKNIQDLIKKQESVISMTESIILMPHHSTLHSKITINDAYSYLNLYAALADNPKQTAIMQLALLGFYYGFDSEIFKQIIMFECKPESESYQSIMDIIYDHMLANNSIAVSDITQSGDKIKIKARTCDLIYNHPDPEIQLVENALIVNSDNRAVNIIDDKFSDFVTKCKSLTGKQTCALLYTPLFTFQGVDFDQVVTFSSGRMLDIKELQNKLVIVRLSGLVKQMKTFIINQLIKFNIKAIIVSEGRNPDVIDIHNIQLIKTKLNASDPAPAIDAKSDYRFTIRVNNINVNLSDYFDEAV